MSTEALTEFLRIEIPPRELSDLLDEHLHEMVEWIHRTGEPWTDEQASTYYHLRRLRDLFAVIGDEQPQALAS